MWSVTAVARDFYLTHLSRPAADRTLYKLIQKHQLRRLVELGVGVGDRAERLIEVAARTSGAGSVFYTGIDLFEARPKNAAAGLPLKTIHKKLAATGVKVRLLPGDPYAAFSRTINMLGVADLVVISADQDRASLARAWWFIDRLLQDGSHVQLETASGDGKPTAFQTVARTEVRQLATVDRPRRAA